MPHLEALKALRGHFLEAFDSMEAAAEENTALLDKLVSQRSVRQNNDNRSHFACIGWVTGPSKPSQFEDPLSQKAVIRSEFYFVGGGVNIEVAWDTMSKDGVRAGC
jgi:hypothetical protein